MLVQRSEFTVTYEQDISDPVLAALVALLNDRQFVTVDGKFTNGDTKTLSFGKIQAIKLYREIYNCSLLDAKWAIEHIQSAQWAARSGGVESNR